MLREWVIVEGGGMIVCVWGGGEIEVEENV